MWGASLQQVKNIACFFISNFFLFTTDYIIMKHIILHIYFLNTIKYETRINSVYKIQNIQSKDISSRLFVGH